MADIKSDPRIPVDARGFFDVLLGTPPITSRVLTGALSRNNASSSGSVDVAGTRVIATFNETLRLAADQYDGARGAIVAGIRAQRENAQFPFVTVTGGEFDSSGVIHTIANLEITVDCAELDRVCALNDTVVGQLAWLWEVLRLVLRLEGDGEKTLAQQIAVLAALPASTVDPLEVDAGDTHDDQTPVPEATRAAAPIDPMAVLDGAQREIVTRLQAGMSTFDVKAGRLKGDELKAALAFQQAGGVFTRSANGRDGQLVVSNVCVDPIGNVRQVAMVAATPMRTSSRLEAYRARRGEKKR